MSLFDDLKNRFCSGLLTPNDFTAFLRLLLTQHFSNSEQILSEYLKSRLFVEDTNTGIVIESVGAWTPNTAERRPAILLARGEWKRDIMGIGNGTDYSTTGGLLNYYRRITGQHNIICVGKTRAEAEELGMEVFYVLTTLEPLIYENIPKLMFHAMSLSATSRLKEYRDHYACAVGVVYSFTFQFNISHTEVA